jgi:hypothetical protein
LHKPTIFTVFIRAYVYENERIAYEKGSRDCIFVYVPVSGFLFRRQQYEQAMGELNKIATAFLV